MTLKQRQAGITIAEVLIAMAILFVGVYAVFRVFPSGLTVVETTTFTEMATRLNQQRLEFFQNQPLMVPDAVALVTLDSNGNLLPLNEVQPDYLPGENRIRFNPPAGCIDPEDPGDTLCNAMSAWKRVIGEPHVVQALTAVDSNGNPLAFPGVVLGQAPIYFNPNPPPPGDVLDPVFYREAPVNPTVIDTTQGRLVFTPPDIGSVFIVSYRWTDNNNIVRGVSDEVFRLQSNNADYTVAAAVGNLNWTGFVPGTIRVVKIVRVSDRINVDPVSGNVDPTLGMDKVGLVPLVGVSPGDVVKANYTVHVVRDSSGNFQPAWRSVVEEFKLQPDNQLIPMGNQNFCATGKTQLLFKNLDDAATFHFLRQDGSRVLVASVPGTDLRIGLLGALLDPNDVNDGTLIFGSLISGSNCPPLPTPAVLPAMRMVGENLRDWSQWTEVAAKTYMPLCPRDPSSLTPCRSPEQIPQTYREYIEDQAAGGLIFQPSEVGKTVAVDYIWLDTSFNPPRPATVTGEMHTIGDASQKFGFSLQRPFVSILEVRGVSLKAHASWSSGGKYRQVITASTRVPPQTN